MATARKKVRVTRPLSNAPASSRRAVRLVTPDRLVKMFAGMQRFLVANSAASKAAQFRIIGTFVAGCTGASLMINGIMTKDSEYRCYCLPPSASGSGNTA